MLPLHVVVESRRSKGWVLGFLLTLTCEQGLVPTLQDMYKAGFGMFWEVAM